VPDGNRMPPLIECVGLDKWYGGVHALRGVSLSIAAGESLGLVGDNGAGKSTLIKILSGVHRPDGGEVRLDGARADIRNPRAAMRLGIETIYQNNSMVPAMSVARNLFIGREPTTWSVLGFGPMDLPAMNEASLAALRAVDLHLASPATPVSELSGGQRQGVAIARAMHFRSRLLILDEPTNHLSVKEIARVLGFVRGLGAQGIASIFISHNIQHVFSCCDRVVAMARGEIVADRPVAATSVEEISALL
jgi:simple sugar transport system ATP-binding protein